MAKTKTEKVKKTKKVAEEPIVEVVTPETVNTEDTIASFINNVQEEAFTQKESEALNLPLRDDVKKEETEDKTPEEVDNTPVEEENPDVEVKAEEDVPELDVDENGDDTPAEDKEVVTAEAPTELQEDAKFDQPEDVKDEVEQPKKPKKRRTLQEMYGYDWLGQSYDE